MTAYKFKLLNLFKKLKFRSIFEKLKLMMVSKKRNVRSENSGSNENVLNFFLPNY